MIKELQFILFRCIPKKRAVYIFSAKKSLATLCKLVKVRLMITLTPPDHLLEHPLKQPLNTPGGNSNIYSALALHTD